MVRCHHAFPVRTVLSGFYRATPCDYRADQGTLCAPVHPVRPRAPLCAPCAPCAPLCIAVRSVRLAVLARTVTRFRAREFLEWRKP